MEHMSQTTKSLSQERKAKEIEGQKVKDIVLGNHLIKLSNQARKNKGN